MSGEALRGMRTLLAGVGVCRLTEAGAADPETEAYGVGFAPLEQELERLLRELFLPTMSEESLARWEALYHPQSPEGTLEERRTILQKQMAQTPEKLTPEDFSDLLGAAGVRGAVTEDGEGGLRVLFGTSRGFPQEEMTRSLDRILPAHLTWALDEGLHWAALDAHDISFEAWDGSGLTWAQREAMTREQLRALAARRTEEEEEA